MKTATHINSISNRRILKSLCTLGVALSLVCSPTLSSAAVAKRAQAPSEPRSVIASPHNAFVDLTWTASKNYGGSPITGYVVSSTPTSQGCRALSTSCRVKGLVNGTTYTFTVVATNAVGASSPSLASLEVTPFTVPGQPQSVSATPGNTSATVSWAVPIFDGGANISQYTVTSRP